MPILPLRRLSLLVLCALLLPNAALAAKPSKDKAKSSVPVPEKSADEPADKAPDKPAGPHGVGKPSTGLRADAQIAKILTQLDKALAQKPDDKQDLSGQVLVAMARSAMVAVVHGHFALAGLGQALRSGGMPAAEVTVMAKTIAQNYAGIAEAFGAMAQNKAFDGDLADLFRSLQILSEQAGLTANALVSLAGAASDGQRLQVFEAALEDYRGRLQALMAHLNGKSP